MEGCCSYKYFLDLNNRSPVTVCDEGTYCWEREKLKKGDDSADGCSCGGRMWCVLNVFEHTAGIVLRPIVFLVKGIAYFFFVSIYLAITERSCSSVSDSMCKGLHFFACAIISPVGQVVKTIRAFVGIFHPGAYYVAYVEIEVQRDAYGNRAASRVTSTGAPMTASARLAGV